jgi:hypothetical protein
MFRAAPLTLIVLTSPFTIQYIWFCSIQNPHPLIQIIFLNWNYITMSQKTIGQKAIKKWTKNNQEIGPFWRMRNCWSWEGPLHEHKIMYTYLTMKKVHYHIHSCGMLYLGTSIMIVLVCWIQMVFLVFLPFQGIWRNVMHVSLVNT